jgi:agmatine deiminase
LITDTALHREILKKGKEYNLDTSRISFHLFPYNEFWTRDMGPRFLTKNHRKKAMADFGFNTWSYADEHDSLAMLDEKLDEKIAESMKIPLYSSSLIAEGGDNEINGKGVLMLTESVQFLRNPNLSKIQIEREYRKIIGATSFIWFKKGLRDDDFTLNGPLVTKQGDSLFTCLTTNGHVDEYARFANDSTILMASGDVHSENLIEKETAERLAENLKILRGCRNADGKPFRVIFLPLVPIQISTMKKGDGTYEILQSLTFKSHIKYGNKDKPEKMIAAASYLNFVIINKLVLVPFYDLETDEKALAAFKKAFPDKKIFPINPLALNWGGGGMHCITQNEPF